VAGALVDLTEFEVWLVEWHESHRAGGLGSGRFARFPRGPLDGLSCADFAIVDYTTGPWPLAPSEQDARVAVLQQFQSPETGLFEEDAPPARRQSSRLRPGAGGDTSQQEELRGEAKTPPPFAERRPAGQAREGNADGARRLDPWAATAHFVAALELLGARPLLPLRSMDEARTPAGIVRMLEGLDWSDPLASARGAHVSACLAVTGDVGPEWFERFFAWLDREADPSTGLWRRGVQAPLRDALAAAFRYFALYDRFRRPLPHASAALMTALGLQLPDGLYAESGPGWTELAAAFVMDRAFRQCGEHRAREKAALENLARATAARLRDPGALASLDADPHAAAGLMSLLAVLSQALPGSVKSRGPLRLYLERHLFV